jgi:uncharacterized integral membrane protein (TIGR00698 family)
MIALALFFGVVLSLLVSVSLKDRLSKWVGPLLKINMIGLGFGLGAGDFAAIEPRYIGLVFLGAALTGSVGWILWRYLNIKSVVAGLIVVGTAICGGSAIAAVAPVVKAKTQDIVVALAAVFLLNSVAMVLFPMVGHMIGLPQSLFGIWAGIAIHDTSSVIGAAGLFGDASLKIAVIIKAIRVLLIIPVVIGLSLYTTKKASWRGMPWFLWLFIGAVLLNFEIASPIFPMIYLWSKKLTILPIFLMGLSFSMADLRQAGVKPFVYAGILWLVVSASILGLILI